MQDAQGFPVVFGSLALPQTCSEHFKYRRDPWIQCGLMTDSYLQYELSYDL